MSYGMITDLKFKFTVMNNINLSDVLVLILFVVPIVTFVYLTITSFGMAGSALDAANKFLNDDNRLKEEK